jgi:hypothetical protein
MPHRVSPGFQARRALLRSLAPRYQQASSAQKTLLLDSFVEWTGYTRKYAIELLNHGKHDQQIIQRHRSPQYGQEVQQALFLAGRRPTMCVPNGSCHLCPVWWRCWKDRGTCSSRKKSTARCSP